jgi:hypothetical protein
MEGINTQVLRHCRRRMQSPLTQGKDLGADPNYIPPPRLNGKVRRLRLDSASVLIATTQTNTQTTSTWAIPALARVELDAKPRFGKHLRGASKRPV